MKNGHKIIIGLIFSAFFLLSLPISYAQKSVYSGPRCNCTDGQKGECIAGIGLRKIDSASQGSTLNYYSVRIQVPATNNCAKVTYNVNGGHGAWDTYTRVITEGVYTENFSLVQSLGPSDVRVQSCIVCTDKYKDDINERSEEEKKYINDSLNNSENRAREANKYFNSLGSQSRLQEGDDFQDDLALLDDLAEDKYQENRKLEKEMYIYAKKRHQEIIRMQEQIRQNELQRQRAVEEGDDEGGGFLEFLGNALFGIAMGTAMVADIEGGTSHNTKYVADSMAAIVSGSALPVYPGAGSYNSGMGGGSLGSGGGGCELMRQKKPELDRLINQANNTQGVCDKSRAAVKVLQLTLDVNRRCNMPQAQIQSAKNSLNGAKQSARDACENGAF